MDGLFTKMECQGDLSRTTETGHLFEHAASKDSDKRIQGLRRCELGVRTKEHVSDVRTKAHVRLFENMCG